MHLTSGHLKITSLGLVSDVSKWIFLLFSLGLQNVTPVEQRLQVELNCIQLIRFHSHWAVLFVFDTFRLDFVSLNLIQMLLLRVLLRARLIIRLSQHCHRADLKTRMIVSVLSKILPRACKRNTVILSDRIFLKIHIRNFRTMLCIVHYIFFIGKRLHLNVLILSLSNICKETRFDLTSNSVFHLLLDDVLPHLNPFLRNSVLLNIVQKRSDWEVLWLVIRFQSF